MTEILGFGTPTMASATPRPLGAQRSTLVYISQNQFSAAALTQMGNRQSSGGNQQITSFGVGQGLYYGIDTFLYFTPMPQRELMSSFGGLLRTLLFRDPTERLQFAATVSASGTNFENQAFFTNTGVDVVMTYLGSALDFSVGIGRARCISEFIGGTNGVTDSGVNEYHEVFLSHLMLSASYDYRDYNFVLTWDRYEEGRLNMKAGYRF